AVVMGSETSKIRFEESMRLLDYGFANYDSVTIGRKGEVIDKVLIQKGDSQYLEVVLEKDSYLLLPKGQSKDITKEILLPEYVNTPIKKGDVIGELVIKIDGKDVDRVKLVAKNDVARATIKDMFLKLLKNYINN